MKVRAFLKRFVCAAVPSRNSMLSGLHSPASARPAHSAPSSVHLPLRRYHPNSYIASRRSSLPRQGYGGVYERASSSPWLPNTPSPSTSSSASAASASASRRRELRGLPRHLSEYSFWASASSPGSGSGGGGVLLPDSDTASPLARKSESVTTLATFTSNSGEEAALPPTVPEVVAMPAKVEPCPPSPPPPEPAPLSLDRRERGPEERRLLDSAARAKRARGEISGLPSAQLLRLACELFEMDGEEEERPAR